MGWYLGLWDGIYVRTVTLVKLSNKKSELIHSTKDKLPLKFLVNLKHFNCESEQ